LWQGLWSWQGLWHAMISSMTIEQPWFIGSWIGVVERPETVDEAIDRNDEYAGVALLALVLNHPEPEVGPPRIKKGLASSRAQTKANALQSLATTPACTGRLTVNW